VTHGTGDPDAAPVEVAVVTEVRAADRNSAATSSGRRCTMKRSFARAKARRRPDERSNQADGAIGELPPFHKTSGYYALG